MKRKVYRKGIFFVVYKKEEGKIVYLILKRKLHWTGWEFPKAGLEKNENEMKALKRELKEEVKGCKVLKIKKFNIKGKYLYHKEMKDREEYIGQTYTLFGVEVECKNVKFDKREHSDYKWLEFNRAYKILRWPNQKKSLRIVDRYVLKCRY